MPDRIAGLRESLIALALAGVFLVSSSIAPERMPVGASQSAAAPALKSDTVRLATGIRMHYVEVGPADGRPVLMLHGFTDSWRSYQLLLPHLPAGYRFIIPDQRGHGDTDAPDCCFRMRDLAQDAVALLDVLGIQQADVVGHSMGSFVAQRIAMDRPDRIGSMVLVGSGVHVRVPAVLEMLAIVDTLRDPVPLEFAHAFQSSTVHVTPAAALIDTMAAGSARVPARLWRALLHGMLADDPEGALPDVQAPTLIIAGELDAIFPPAEQEKLRAAIPGSQLLVYAETGHAPHWERPGRFADDLTAFLSRDPRVSGR